MKLFQFKQYIKKYKLEPLKSRNPNYKFESQFARWTLQLSKY